MSERDDRAHRVRQIQAEFKEQVSNRRPEQQAAFEAWLASLPPLTARQRKVLAQVRVEIDAGFTDGVDGAPDDR